jgi:hypothetical protein
VSVRVIIPASLRCPHCLGSGDAIRAWRTNAQIFYVCGQCDETWTVDVEPAEQASDVMSKIKRVLS